MPTTKDTYKLRREADEKRTRENNQLLYGFFGKQAEPIREVQQRLNQQLRLTEVNKMKSEIKEINATSATNDKLTPRQNVQPRRAI